MKEIKAFRNTYNSSIKRTPPEKTNTPSNQNDKGNLTPSKGIFPHTGENQMLSNILLIVGTGILIILTVYYILKKDESNS